jgi:hypothetical protein
MMTAQFDLNLSSGCIKTDAFAVDGGKIFKYRLCANGTVYESIDDINDSPICEACITQNITNTIKITSKFKNRAVFKEFNSSFTSDLIDFYINSVGFINRKMMNISGYDTSSFKRFTLIKENNTQGFIDDVYVYTGSDPNYDTTQDLFSTVSLIVYETETNTTLGTGASSDLSTQVSSLWYTMGLRSTTSRVMFGLFLMVVITVAIIAAFIRFGMPVSAPALIILNIMFMIFLTYIGLLPIWIPVLLGIIAAGIAVIAVKLGGE